VSNRMLNPSCSNLTRPMHRQVLLLLVVIESQVLAPCLWRKYAMRVGDAVDLRFAELVAETDRVTDMWKKQSLAMERANASAVAQSKCECR
jgi:hypothetical protein